MISAKDCFGLIFLVFIPWGVLAQGPPCWDSVPPATKYKTHHSITGDAGVFAPSDSGLTRTLSVDGLNVSTQMTDGDRYLEVEVTITNCSPKIVQIDPKNFWLVIEAPNGDHDLRPLDPTQFVQFPKSGKTFPALLSEITPYGRIEVFRTFFTRDGNARSTDRMQSNYSLRMTVPIESWNFNFRFPRRKS